MSNFNMKFQPYFVALHSDASVLGTATYNQVKSTELLNRFLDQTLKAFKVIDKE